VQNFFLLHNLVWHVILVETFHPTISWHPHFGDVVVVVESDYVEA